MGGRLGPAPGGDLARPAGGGAFAALLGLAGTGLARHVQRRGADPAWRELRGPMTAFGRGRNRWNAPVPTVIPSMGLTLTADQLRLVAVRNGFAMRDVDGEPLFGAQPFKVTWRACCWSSTRASTGSPPAQPTPDGDRARVRGRPSDQRWRLVAAARAADWVLLNHRLAG